MVVLRADGGLGGLGVGTAWFGGVDVEVEVDVGVDNGVAPIIADANVIDASGSACGMLPCPAVVAMEIGESAGSAKPVLVNELDKIVGVDVVAVGVEIAKVGRVDETDASICVNKNNKLDMPGSFMKPFIGVFPPFGSDVLLRFGMWSVTNKDVESDDGGSGSDKNPAAIEITHINDLEVFLGKEELFAIGDGKVSTSRDP